MTRTELESLIELTAVNVHLATMELFFDEIDPDEMLQMLPDEVREEVSDYKRHTKELNEKLRECVIAKFAPLLTEDDKKDV